MAPRVKTSGVGPYCRARPWLKSKRRLIIFDLEITTFVSTFSYHSFLLCFVFFFSEKREQTKFRLTLAHSCVTTEEVGSGIIEWPLPPVLTLNSWKTVGQSINIIDVFNSATMVIFKVIDR